MATPPAPPSPRLSATAHQAPNWSARASLAHVHREAASKSRSESEAFAQEALGAACRHEEPAVGALEAPVAFGLAGHQLGLEGLLAVRAHDLAHRFLGGDLGHVATLPVLGQE